MFVRNKEGLNVLVPVQFCALLVFQPTNDFEKSRKVGSLTFDTRVVVGPGRKSRGSPFSEQDSCRRVVSSAAVQPTVPGGGAFVLCVRTK